MEKMAAKHSVPASTFRDMFNRPIDPQTGVPRMGHKSSHLKLLSAEEEWVSFIYLTWLASLPT